MAEEEQEGEETTTGSPDGEEESGGSKKTLIIIIVAVVFVIAAIVIALLFLFSEGEQQGVRGLPEEQEYVSQYNLRMQNTLEPVTQPLYSGPYSYTVNMKNGVNFIHMTLRLVMKDELAQAYLEARTPEIDDRIITLLKSKFPSDINTRTGLEILKQEIYNEFNDMFSDEYIEQSLTKDRTPVKQVLVNEFYVQ